MAEVSAQGQVEAVYVAAVETFALPNGDSHTSAIRKHPQPGPVAVGTLGFEGDEQHDPGHGCGTRAVGLRIVIQVVLAEFTLQR